MLNFTWNRFPIKNCWSILCLHPSWKVHTWVRLSDAFVLRTLLWVTFQENNLKRYRIYYTEK